MRGQVIVENDELVAQPGAGQFVKRARSGEELLPAGGGGARQRDRRARHARSTRRRGSARASTLGSRPAVLVVDFSCGFTDPECALGSDLTAEVEATKRLLDAARAKGLPVVFTTIGFEPSLKDGGLWLQKVPALGDAPGRRSLGRDRPAARAARATRRSC